MIDTINFREGYEKNIEVVDDEHFSESNYTANDSETLINVVDYKQAVETQKKNKRVHWADCARIFSMLAIVFLHSASYSVEKDLKAKDKGWKTVCIYNCITRFGVPMFVLLSGMFILDPSKKFSFEKLFKRNIFRLATAFVLWSFVNTVLKIFVYKTNKFKEFLSLFIVGEEYLWFIYMIIGCYMISPFLRLFSDNIFLARYFLGLCLFFGSIIPTVQNILEVNNMDDAEDDFDAWVGRWHFHFTMEFVGYFVAGYHIVKYVNIQSLLIRLGLYFIGIIDVILICYFTIAVEKKGTGYSKHFRDTYTFPIAVYSVILFIFFKHEIGRINFSERAIKIINKLSGLTFGVYLVHMVLKGIFQYTIHLTPQRFFGTKYSATIGCPVFFVIITIVSFIISYLLSITPVLNKYVM